MIKKTFVSMIAVLILTLICAGCVERSKVGKDKYSLVMSGNELIFFSENNNHSRSPGYYISGDVITDPRFHNTINLSEIDLDTLELKGMSHLCDKNNCYADLVKIEGVNPKEFHVIENLLAEDDENIYLCDKVLTKKKKYEHVVGDFSSYLKTDDTLYAYMERVSRPIEDYEYGEPSFVTKLENSGYCIANTYITSGSVLKLGGDFVRVGDIFLWGGFLLSGFNAYEGNLRYLGGNFMRDGVRMWGGFKPITGLDMDTVEYIGGQAYIKDKNGIYCIDKKISEDPLFEVIGDGNYAKDSENIYFAGEKVDCGEGNPVHEEICSLLN